MSNPIKIELLSPAKNKATGIAAINHGADAVYIGAPKFSARGSASNSIKDIEELIKYAHLYRVKIYAAFNTILFDNEFEEALSIIYKLYEIGIDALIIQEMGLLETALPPVKLIASTQTHNTTIEKVLFLEKAGFSRVILPRELSLVEIKRIKSATKIELEAFVHGALCVCYSGQCGMSQAISGRSGNRGVCAQPCRHTYTMSNEKGEILAKNKHLLSIKDLNLYKHISSLIDAGVTSFKIEGRLKDIPYVANITALYRAEIDNIIERSNHRFKKGSSGKVYLYFTPDPEKTFNRGYTDYLITGKRKSFASPNTAKSIGTDMGHITYIGKDHMVIESDKKIYAGDGLCFFNKQNILEGFYVNKVDGNNIYPNHMPSIAEGTTVYRNYDHLFYKKIDDISAIRKILVNITLRDTSEGFEIRAKDEDGIEASHIFHMKKNIPINNDKAINAIEKQLSKTGNTPYEINKIDLSTSEPYFIPVSIINNMRRTVIDNLTEKRITTYKIASIKISPNNYPYLNKELDEHENIINKKSMAFYKRHQVNHISLGFELLEDYKGKIIMTTKYCLRFEFGLCHRFQQAAPYTDTLYLKDKKHTYRLKFDCQRCEMDIILEQ